MNSSPIVAYQSLHQLTRCNLPGGGRLGSSRCTTWATVAGLEVLERLEVLPVLEAARKVAYINHDLGVLELLGKKPYSGYREMSSGTYAKLDVDEATSGRLGELARTAGVPMSTIAFEAVIAGLAQSVSLVPVNYRLMFAEEVLRFALHLEWKAQMWRQPEAVSSLDL